jgi:hypothetical protein
MTNSLANVGFGTNIKIFEVHIFGENGLKWRFYNYLYLTYEIFSPKKL